MRFRVVLLLMCFAQPSFAQSRNVEDCALGSPGTIVEDFLRGVYFDHESAALRPDAIIYLNELISAYPHVYECSKVKLRLEAFAAENETNQAALAKKRSRTVSTYLLSHGFKRQWMTRPVVRYDKLTDCRKNGAGESCHENNRFVFFGGST